MLKSIFALEFMVVEFLLEFAVAEFVEFAPLFEFAFEFISSTPLTRGFKFARGLLEKLVLKFIIQNPLCINLVQNRHFGLCF